MNQLTSIGTDIINETIGKDRKNLGESTTSLIEKLKEERDKINKTLLSNIPINHNDIDQLDDDINKIQIKLNNLKQTNKQLNETLFNYKTEINSSNNQTTIDNELKPLILKTMSIERSLSYFNCLKQINELNLIIESNLSDLKKIQAQIQKEKDKESQLKHINKYNQLITKTIESYLELKSHYKTLINSNCSNLNQYITNLIKYLHKEIRQLIVNDTDEIFKSLSYPFQNNVQFALLKKENKELVELNKKKLELEAERLAKIEFDDSAEDDSNDRNHKEATLNLTIFIYVLRIPLQKRFKYHFYGNRKTNDLNKPEWFLSQVIQWIKDHDFFLSEVIQPILDNHYFVDKKTKFNAVTEFIKSMIDLIREKFYYDYNKYTDEQFTHTIDELIVFDQQLKKYFRYPIDEYNCLNLLCENEKIFTRWLQLEYTISLKKIDLMFTQSDLWSCNYADVDEHKPPHCTESFMLLLRTICDRYMNLPSACKKLRFLKLQLKLLNNYHQRLVQIKRDIAKTPLSKTNFGVLNSINYILYILNEWKNLPFYIQMQFIQTKYKQFLKKYQSLSETKNTETDETDNTNGEEIDESKKEIDQIEGDDDDDYDYSNSFYLQLNEDLCKTFDLQMNALNDANSLFSELIDTNKTVFDTHLPSFEKVHNEMENRLIENCLWEVKSRSRNYRKEKWMAMPSFKDYYKQNLTESASEMLISLKNILHLLQESLATKLFIDLLKKLTSELDKLFYEELILETQFNDGGCSQIEYDINKYLLPILYEFADKVKIETYLRRTKEAISLLQLNQGTTLLLKETLNEAVTDGKESILLERNAQNKLKKDFGITQLTCRDALRVLNLKISF